MNITQLLNPYLPLIAVTLFAVAGHWLAYWLLIGRHEGMGNERKFPRQLMMLAITLSSIVAIVIVLPIEPESRNQVLALIGLLTSGLFAFSSTTVVTNLTAGLLLRVTSPFRTGDFIRVGDHFGRVVEKGLFDTEIQSESRELIALPNLYLISNPVTTIHKSGTVISTSLSLGYDLHHERIEQLLIRAAKHSGLEDPFVHVLELGDFSVTYRVSGMLAEVKGLITARSSLCRAVLDELHGNGIEIMSPTFMNQRRMPDEHKVLAVAENKKTGPRDNVAEDLVFDKAEAAEQRDKKRQDLEAQIQALEAQLKDADKNSIELINKKIESCHAALESIESELLSVEQQD